MEIAAEHVIPFEHDVRLVSCAPEHNRQCFYVFRWQRSLSGERVLVCTWGWMGTLGRSRSIFVPESSPGTSLQRLINRRLKRGYDVCCMVLTVCTLPSVGRVCTSLTVGQWRTPSCDGRVLNLCPCVSRQRYPHSLGLCVRPDMSTEHCRAP